VVARGNNRECCGTAAEDVAVRWAHLRELSRTDAVPVYAYTLMANHVHLLLRAPTRDALGRPLRWFMTEAAKVVHRERGRRGHCWERRYRACVVEDDAQALAALRYLDRNPGRAGLGEDPAAYPWSSCAADALGAPKPMSTLHPRDLALSPYAKIRPRHDRALGGSSADRVADARDPRWTTQRAISSPAFVAHPAPRRRGRPKRAGAPTANQPLTT
jgi:putative transposase